MEHRRRFVCALLNDGSVNEPSERIVSVLVFDLVSALKLLVVPLLNGGVEPSRGHTRLREQRERTQLASSHLLRTILHTVDGVFDGHPQCRCDVVRVITSRHGANDVFLAVRLQSLEIPGQ